MRAIHFLFVTGSIAAMLGTGCVADPDELELLVEESDDDALDELVDELAAQGAAAAMPEESPCPGDCEDPPVCHYGPGQCIEDPYSGPWCWYPQAFNGEICDDGNECTLSECLGGGCTVYDYVSEGFPCDDGDPSTVDDACDGAGSCVGQVSCPGDCEDPPVCHYGPGECFDDPYSGPWCWYPPAFNGQICDDGNECTISECLGGGCTVYDYVNEGFPCDDGDPNTVDDVCDGAGTCEGELTCPGGCDDPPPCHYGPGQCLDDPYSGPYCWYPQAFNGEVCDGGVECMAAECIGGACVNYGFAWQGTPCDDEDPCTINDVCDGAGVCGGSPTPCPQEVPVEAWAK